MGKKQCISAIFLMGATLLTSIHAQDAENLELKAISEYWKEKDYATVKIQIRDFLAKYPNSPYADQLHALLGDLFFQEKKYSDAFQSYSTIQDKQWQLKCGFRKIHSLYEIGDYENLTASVELLLQDPSLKQDHLETIYFEAAESYFYLAHCPENEGRKNALLLSALAYYQKLEKTFLADMTLLPKARIHAALQEHEKAAELYLCLAHRSNAREEHLFEAARHQSYFDKKAAIETFQETIDTDGALAPRAAFNKLALLFEEKRYEDFILSQEALSHLIPQEKASLIRFYLGKSHVFSRDFERAIPHLSESCACSELQKEERKSALISLSVCAKEMSDLSVFEHTLDAFKKEFSDDLEMANILIMHAQVCRDKKHWASSRNSVKELLSLFPDHPQRQSLLYNSALTFLEEEKWDEGASAIQAFLQEFPEDPQTGALLRHCVSARLKSLKQASYETRKVKQEQLLGTLKAAMQEKETFTPEEMKNIQLLAGKTLYALGRYDEAIETLTPHTQEFEGDPSYPDFHLTLALCYNQGLKDDMQFALHLEKALENHPNLSGATDFHLALFNIYLKETQAAPAKEKADWMAKAADHLFCALDKPISSDNQRWLAGYYFEQSHSKDPRALERAAIVLEKLLEMQPYTPDREKEVLKLASVYEKMHLPEKQVILLQDLRHAQNASSEEPWKYHRLTQFELGKAYASLGEKEKAIHTYEDLITSSSHASSYFASAAKLEKTKLEFSLLPAEECYEDSEALMALCNTLKSIEVQRKLYSEPLHLEAALCYVEMKTAFTDPQEQAQKQYFLLEQVKNNFSSLSDPQVIDYLSAAAKFPEKERLYTQYMLYIDAELLRLNIDSDTQNQVKQQLDQLLGSSSDQALRVRIQKSMEALDKSL